MRNRKDVFQRLGRVNNGPESSFSSNAAEPPKQASGSQEPVVAGSDLWHSVDETDNLVALAVRYGTTVASIRRLNRGLTLLSSSIPPHIDRLRIRSGVDSIAPVNEETRSAQRKFLREQEFMVLCPSAAEEQAMYYLSCADDDVKKAAASYNQDLQWEESVKLSKRVGVDRDLAYRYLKSHNFDQLPAERALRSDLAEMNNESNGLQSRAATHNHHVHSDKKQGAELTPLMAEVDSSTAEE